MIDATPVPIDAVPDAAVAARTFVFIETNDPAKNALLGFERASNGQLKPTRSFATGGVGLTAGATQRLGPLDSDREIIVSPDQRFVYAVNSGDDTVATFTTASDGTLTPVSGSPFPSGGPNPVSLGLVNSTLHVANKAVAGTTTPSYTATTVHEGSLALIPAATFDLPIGASPSIAYISPNRRLMFGTEFFDQARPNLAPAGQIDSFVLSTNGTLRPAPGSPYALPADTSGITPPPLPVALNLVAHPTANVLYVGFVTRSQIGVYTYNATTGQLTFVRAVPNSGKATGWFLINAKGTRLYSVNSGSATISVYDLTDPLRPVELKALALADAMSGPPFVDAAGVTQTVTSAPFQFAFDPEQTHLYVVSQRVTTNANDPTGNFLHTLDIAADGTLSEPVNPIDLRTLGVPPQARPQGVAVVTP